MHVDPQRVNTLSGLQLAKNIALGREAGPYVKSLAMKEYCADSRMLALTLTCLLN